MNFPVVIQGVDKPASGHKKTPAEAGVLKVT